MLQLSAMKGPLLLLPLLATPVAATQEPPKKGELTDLVEEYFALDWKDTEDLRRMDEILERVGSVPALNEREAKRWRKDLAKAWSQGPKLPKRGSRHHLWEEEERGLFYLAGKTKKPKGLFIGMHGGGVGSGDASNAQGFWQSAVQSAGWVGIFPQVLEKTERGWTDSGTEEFVLELVERALRTYGVDRDRVYLGGHSMGGYGTWTLGARHADLVAGLTPSAGAPNFYIEQGRAADLVEGVIPNLRNVPMVIFQSTDDPKVPPDVNQLAVRLLGEARERWGGYADQEYWEVDGNGHDIPPGGMRALIEKIEPFERGALPERVVWQPTLEWVRQSYWLRWDRPRENALVVADLDREANAVDVELEGDAAGLYVLLSEDLVDLAKEVVLRLNGDEVFRGVPERTLAALLATARRGDPQLTFDVRIPLR